jgi:hypothetical protein
LHYRHSAGRDRRRVKADVATQAIRTPTFSVSEGSFLESVEVEGEPEGSNNGGGADDGRDQDLLVSGRSSDPVRQRVHILVLGKRRGGRGGGKVERRKWK